MLCVIDQRGVTALVVDADGRAEGMADVLGDAFDARFHLVLDFMSGVSRYHSTGWVMVVNGGLSGWTTTGWYRRNALRRHHPVPDLRSSGLENR